MSSEIPICWSGVLRWIQRDLSAIAGAGHALRAPFDRLIPLVEFALETPLNRGEEGRTTGTINLESSGRVNTSRLELRLLFRSTSTRETTSA